MALRIMGNYVKKKKKIMGRPGDNWLLSAPFDFAFVVRHY